MNPYPPQQQQETMLSRLQYRRHLRAFPVAEPVTLYVRGSQCRVAVQYHEYDHVEIHASLYAAFGMRLVVEQDTAGVYVVLKRRRILGLFSRSEVLVVVPEYCHLAFDVTPGEVIFQKINGTLEIPATSINPQRKTVMAGSAHETLPPVQQQQLSTGEELQ